jgi:hypothetical protein
MEQDMFVLENEYGESLKREKVEKEMESIFWN